MQRLGNTHLLSLDGMIAISKQRNVWNILLGNAVTSLFCKSYQMNICLMGYPRTMSNEQYLYWPYKVLVHIEEYFVAHTYLFIIHPCDPTVVIYYLIWPCDAAVCITYLISHSSSFNYNAVIKGWVYNKYKTRPTDSCFQGTSCENLMMYSGLYQHTKVVLYIYHVLLYTMRDTHGRITKKT